MMMLDTGSQIFSSVMSAIVTVFILVFVWKKPKQTRKMIGAIRRR